MPGLFAFRALLAGLHNGRQQPPLPTRFDLRSGLAGEVPQKFANFRVGLAVVGDITAQVSASTALRDFVREPNRGRQAWFLSDEAELQERLAAAAGK